MSLSTGYSSCAVPTVDNCKHSAIGSGMVRYTHTQEKEQEAQQLLGVADRTAS